jgi:hypothetical protein
MQSREGVYNSEGTQLKQFIDSGAIAEDDSWFIPPQLFQNGLQDAQDQNVVTSKDSELIASGTSI